MKGNFFLCNYSLPTCTCTCTLLFSSLSHKPLHPHTPHTTHTHTHRRTPNSEPSRRLHQFPLRRKLDPDLPPQVQQHGVPPRPRLLPSPRLPRLPPHLLHRQGEILCSAGVPAEDCGGQQRSRGRVYTLCLFLKRSCVQYRACLLLLCQGASVLR